MSSPYLMVVIINRPSLLKSPNSLSGINQPMCQIAWRRLCQISTRRFPRPYPTSVVALCLYIFLTSIDYITICDFYQQIVSSNHGLRREKSFSCTSPTFRSSFMAQSMLAGDPSLRMGRCIHRRWNTLCPQTVMDETQTDSWPVPDLNAANHPLFPNGNLELIWDI